MKKSNKRKQRNSSNSSRGVTSALLSSHTTIVPFRGAPFEVTQATSGTGGFTSLNSNGSYTAVNSINIDPFNLGARLAMVADNFLEYRFKWIRFKYMPWGSASGVQSTQTGSTASPTYATRPFCWGVIDDVAIGTLSYGGLIEYGGVVGTTTRPCSLFLRGGSLNRWRFTSTTSASPTNIDLRMVAPFQLRWYFGDGSSTAVSTYGTIMYECVIQFRGAANNAAVIGLSQQGAVPVTTSSSLPTSTFHMQPLIPLGQVATSRPGEEQKETKIEKKGWF